MSAAPEAARARLASPCEGCGADAGEPCRPACLPLTDADARVIAAAWYDGQWSRLYALASTGSPVMHPDGCLPCEVGMALWEVDRAAADHPEHAGELSALAYWLEGWAEQNGVGACLEP